MYQRAFVLGIVLIPLLAGCNDGNESPSHMEVVTAWQTAGVENIELDSKDGPSIAGGDCLHGKAAGLAVHLCSYKDALAADSAKDDGMDLIAGHTGTALVRDQYLLVLADVDAVDVHGKTINTMAKLFLNP